MKKTGLKCVVKLFYVNFNPIVTNDITGIQKFLIEKT